MRKLLKLALLMGAGALLPATLPLYAGAEITTMEGPAKQVVPGSTKCWSDAVAASFDSIWTSRDQDDLPKAVYTAVKREPNRVLEIVCYAFSLADVEQEALIVEAAIRALRDLNMLNCVEVRNIVNVGVAQSDESEAQYAIVDMAKFAAPNCAGMLDMMAFDRLGGLNPGITDGERMGGTNTGNGGGSGQPGTPGVIFEPEIDNPPTGGGGNPPPVEPPDPEGTPTGANPV